MVETERTLVILKPDAVQRSLIGDILGRYEKRGLRIAALKLEHLARETVERHYDAHREKPFFGPTVEYMTSGPVVLLVLEGPDAIAVTRLANGATNSAVADPGTIRGDFALTIGRNVVHASDGPESAAAEIALYFGDGGIVDYARGLEDWTWVK